jgi:acetyl-CoA carboxylase biotin carboxyl carrier protein
MKIDKNIIKELTDYLNEFNLTEIEYADKETKIKISKSSQSVSVAASAPTSSAEKNTKINGIEVKSPIIGTAYHAPEPGAKKFAEVGKRIKKGETIMIVEAMKTMNHVPSTADGIIKEVCVEDGQPVEYGQTIIIVE